MKKLLISALLATSSATMMLSPAIAQPATQAVNSTASKADHSDRMFKRFESLNLSDAQKTQIKTIMQSQRSNTDFAQMRAEHEKLEQSINALANASTLDTRTLNALADAQAQKAKQRFIKRVEMQHAIAQVLTADQRTKLATMQAQKKAEHQKRGGLGKGANMKWGQK